VLLLRNLLAGAGGDARRLLPERALAPLVACLQPGSGERTAVAAMAVLRSLAQADDDDAHEGGGTRWRGALRSASGVLLPSLVLRLAACEEEGVSAAVATLTALLEDDVVNQAALCALGGVAALERLVAPLGWASTSRTGSQVSSGSRWASLFATLPPTIPRGPTHRG
jgi:hypothetical protein